MNRGMEWDEWYHEVCMVIAKKSQCLSRKIGAILVRDKTIISQGYCGPPRGVPHCWERYALDSKLQALLTKDGKTPSEDDINNVCPRYIAGFKSGEGIEWCVSGHAERNALINAARHGIETKGTIMYMDCGVPCGPCLTEIINSGVEEIVITKMEFYDISAEYLLKNSSLKVRVYDHLKI